MARGRYGPALTVAQAGGTSGRGSGKMIFFIIPVYNEATNLPELLSSLHNWSLSRNEPCHVVAVDDGSRDATAEILRAYRDLPITLVTHEVNRGVHEVFRSG